MKLYGFRDNMDKVDVSDFLFHPEMRNAFKE